MQAPLNNPAAQAARLSRIRSLLSHFDAQEASLLALKSLITDVGFQADARDDAQRRQLRKRIDAASELCGRLDHDCGLLLQLISSEFGIDRSNVTVSFLAAAIEHQDAELARALREARQRLTRLTWQVQRISGNTAWILSQRRNIRQAAFEYAGGRSDSDRYDASGRKSMSPDTLRYGARS